MPADEFMAWQRWIAFHQIDGHRGTQVLLASYIAARANTDMYSVAGWLDLDAEDKEEERLASLPKSLRNADRSVQDAFLERREAGRAQMQELLESRRKTP